MKKSKTCRREGGKPFWGITSALVRNAIRKPERKGKRSWHFKEKKNIRENYHQGREEGGEKATRLDVLIAPIWGGGHQELLRSRSPFWGSTWGGGENNNE